MSKAYIIQEDTLVTIADAIRAKKGTTEAIPVTSLAAEIESMVGEDSATPIEVSTEADMTALLTSGEVGGVYKYTGETGTYENGALYVLEERDALQGTWVFNDNITFIGTNLLNIPLAFVSNDTEYAYMSIGAGTTESNKATYYKAEGSSGIGTKAFFRGSFTNTAFQTVEISTTYAELSANYENADLVLTFIQRNAIRQ